MELMAVEVSDLVLRSPVQTMTSNGRQQVKTIRESERGRTGEVVQATLGYKAGF